MKLQDYLLIAGLAILLIAAIIAILKGKASRCTGNCNICPHHCSKSRTKKPKDH